MGCCMSKGTVRKRAAGWRATGIVGLRDAHLKTIPQEVFEISKLVRTLDASGNRIGRLPSLKVLALDSNRLSELPDEVGLLVRLERLSISHNSLTSLPASIGSLRNLILLDVGHNQLKQLPASIGSCYALEELIASANRIQELPQSLSSLDHLKTLVLSDNQISKLPGSLLKDCSMLQTLSLHGNPFTIEDLEQMDGFEEFEARRRKKIDKQLDSNVVTNKNFFDEGIDRKK